MFAFTIGATFTDVTDSVEEFVEEAWNNLVAASEDVIMGVIKYVLYAFRGFVGLAVLCLLMCSYKLLSFIFNTHFWVLCSLTTDLTYSLKLGANPVCNGRN